MPILNRQAAIIELIDGAITACINKKYACAITLAGAAETAMPVTDDRDKFYKAAVIKLFVGAFGGSAKEADAVLNADRNWLKHFNENMPNEISTEYAWFYVIRAYAQFTTTYKGVKETRKMRRLRRMIEKDKDPVFVWFRNLLNVGRRLKQERESIFAKIKISET